MISRAGMLQQQLKFNSTILTSLYREYGVMRLERKKYNDLGDHHAKLMLIADDKLDFDDSHRHCAEIDNFRCQAQVFSPHIRKLRKRIASLEAIQKTLKHELKCAQCLALWTQEDDEFWQQQAAIAQEEGYTWSGSAQEFLAHFGEV